LLSSWKEQGDEKKIHHVFFGTPKKSKRSLRLVKENMARDSIIYTAVTELLQKGVGYNETMRRVAKQLGERDIKDRRSAQGIRAIYKKYQPIPPSFMSFVSFPS